MARRYRATTGGRTARSPSVTGLMEAGPEGRPAVAMHVRKARGGVLGTGPTLGSPSNGRHRRPAPPRRKVVTAPPLAVGEQVARGERHRTEGCQVQGSGQSAGVHAVLSEPGPLRGPLEKSSAGRRQGATVSYAVSGTPRWASTSSISATSTMWAPIAWANC